MMQLSHRDWLYPPQAHKFANHEANVISSRRNAVLFDLTDKLIWVAGQHGMVGGTITRRLRREACHLLRDPGRSVPRKLLDSSPLQLLGWWPKTSLEEGLRMYYEWFLSDQGKLREINIGAEAVSMSR